MPPLLVWADTCLPALEHCSSKGHYGSKLEAGGFKFLWNVGIDIFCTAFTWQEEEGSMGCKAFSRAVGALFVVWIKSPMTTASQRNLRPGRQNRMKSRMKGKVEWKTGEHINADTEHSYAEKWSLTLFYQRQQLWGEFHSIADASIIECYCIMQEAC